jgi:uncharacterized membrane protein
MNKILLFFVVFIFILAVDMVFLNFVSKGFYDSQLKDFPRTLRLWSGLAAWLLIALGAVVFILPLAKSYPSAAMYGALFGLVVYGVYDFTNFAIFKNYTLALTLVDLGWGMTLYAVSSVFAFFISSL